MGKSNSCFKLIVCGANSAENDGYEELDTEIKDSNDKRGWSFRKRSERHRVLSNIVITETPSSVNKESSECTSISCQPRAESNVVEKIYTSNFSDGKPHLSSKASSQMSETIITETESEVDVNKAESYVIIIQAAIRGFLAQRELLKSKNVVKLQAAVRGHLVRQHAVGTLRCVQAIVKMQVLVRVRRARESHSRNHLKNKDGKNDCSKSSGTEHDVTKSNVTYTSIERLLSNSFARQLLDSTPKNKPIHVKCNPSKADGPAWKWLERWMSVSSSDSAEYNKPISISEQSNATKDSSTSLSQLGAVIPAEVFLQSADSKHTVEYSSLPSMDEEKSTTYDATNFNFQAGSFASSLVKDNSEQGPPEGMITHDAKVTTAEINSLQNEEWESDASVPEEPSFLPQKPEIDEQCKLSTKRFSSDQLETEGKNIGDVARKFSNTAFIAAQSKFEGLTSIANSGRSGSLSNQGAQVESEAYTSSVATDTAYRSKEFLSGNSAPYPPRTGGYECGTEISISSTLDSPDRFEARAMESENDSHGLPEGICNSKKKIDHGFETKFLSATSTSSLINSGLDQTEVVGDVIGDMVHSVVVGDSKQPVVQFEKNAPDLLTEQAGSVLQDFKLSPEASQRSQMTITESQGTPSSQVSVKPKESKISKTGSSHKRRILSKGNKSPANANHDSGSRGSAEQLPKHQTSGKRRNSFSSVKYDHIDQEPRDNGSNDSSLPRFMQATKSARAKISANNSPRSTPDLRERDQDIHVKRHSLPGATGRQGSPGIQQASEVHQITKGNVANALYERKWQR
ncbi:putative IQ motif, EF-hand binding, P-loop containing nucleoside triphosphate hydrolase [Lupinus albus]|uniref:Putative IQ motif, EF-hand binding, P-loop containing nucleoside triphosphate hydrolase n=1 Tax=Lupinus albus TaxID=3870 RepID=A0A6A4P2L1_LUPAL|nr:putative IQ motif, EF-hand binding, P-loop containing nucleoside triphosphate hydrolase [Lupinus albus]